MINENFEHYKVFYYVAKLGSITLASEQLYISQSAVSQLIRQLEKNTKCQLFNRTAKGVTLTPEGEMLYSHVSVGCEHLFAGERKLEQMLNLEHGEIHIGASDMTLKFFLLEKLEGFKKKHPKIRIFITNAPTPTTMEQLRLGNIDFGIVSSPLDSFSDIDILPVREIKDVFVAGSAFAELKDKTCPLSILKDYPYICLEKETSTRKYVDGFLSDNGVQLVPDFEISTSDLIVSFAERNLGIGTVVWDFAKQSVSKGDVFVLKMEKEMPSRHINVVRNNRLGSSKAAMELIKFLSDET